MKRFTLDKVANIVLVVTCLIVGGQAGFKMYRNVVPVRPAPVYRLGEIIKDTPDLGLRKARLTLLMITASTCHFCSASMPFYRRLREVAQRAGTRMVAVTPEDPDTNRTYLDQNGVSVETVVSLTKNSIRVRLTPTLILLKSDGVVVNSWQGQLASNLEHDVLSAIGGH